MEVQSASLNAKVAGVSLVAGAAALHLVNQLEPSLLPIRLLVIGILIMGAWAFLHRQKSLRIAGAVGAVASLLPLLALVVGHISIGAGAFLGVSVLLSPVAGQPVITSVPVRSIEAVFLLWSIVTAVFLWKGGMTSERG